jgi:hypothetical protein
VIEVSIDGRHHRVMASGLDRATSPEALCFRDLWNSVSQYLPATDLFDCFSAVKRTGGAPVKSAR